MSALTAESNRHAGTSVSLRSSAGLGWQGGGAELLRVSAGQHRFPAMSYHRLGIHVGTPVRARCACDGRRQARLQAHGDADVVPAGVEGEWTDDADCTILRVWFDDRFVRSIAEQMENPWGKREIRPHLQLRDPRINSLAGALLAEIDAGTACDPLFAESISTAMVVRLLGGTGASEGRGAAVLAAHKATRVTDYIESHLDERLTLGELAALVDLSVPHFKALFRETLGMPVHQYVVRRRVERARALLVEGKLSLSQVALEAGFAHQSHMAHWMTRLLGVTPRAFAKGS
ncbi:MAG TPA: AraC family transcriptional regulator [Paraburkholderia sp.]|uniref:AraC family transcriptional regulator n=1 Tax=Paraburkholderia sp. TaxID=1926495 RepID=UPI002B493888|nr:AraC family transcriptional regulator [Paraburkholderia sp.]HKR39500.1 AraC family transcriptional regulator [Paraburkholderia sp.]